MQSFLVLEDLILDKTVFFGKRPVYLTEGLKVGYLPGQSTVSPSFLSLLNETEMLYQFTRLV